MRAHQDDARLRKKLEALQRKFDALRALRETEAEALLREAQERARAREEGARLIDRTSFPCASTL